MARENQGLQIALIIFVMLTIILGVTTYLFFRQYQETRIKEVANLQQFNEKALVAVKNEEDANKLKRLIFGGSGTAEKVETIETATFVEDMKRFGSAYPEEARFYRPLIEKMAGTLNERNAELADAKAKIAKLEEDFRVREAGKQPQIDTFQQTADKASKDLTEQRAAFNAERERTNQEKASIESDLKAARKQGDADVAAINQKLQEANAQSAKLLAINTNLSDREQKATRKFDVAQGEITWVNQRTGMAWINLGRADSLQRQVTFTVYPVNDNNTEITAKKASIEVTQILGDHLAEVRLYDDKLGDPVMPGDKIFTPIWTPGEKRHYALSGFIDLDGDGRSDMQTVRDVILMNGGVVDSYVDDKGQKIGEMTVNTRYLVLGVRPTEKSAGAMLDAFTKMKTEADRLGVKTMQLDQLLEPLGWKEHSPVVRFGRGMNPKDFAAKSEDELPRKSVGSISDVFKPREPPARVPTSAY